MTDPLGSAGVLHDFSVAWSVLVTLDGIERIPELDGKLSTLVCTGPRWLFGGEDHDESPVT
jgi:hypothetical protein